MRLTFKKLIIHNFLSYAHTEIDLTDKGYCLVSGINQCPKDNALSITVQHACFNNSLNLSSDL